MKLTTNFRLKKKKWWKARINNIGNCSNSFFEKREPELNSTYEPSQKKWLFCGDFIHVTKVLYSGAQWVVLAETEAKIRKKWVKNQKTHITTRQACRKNKNWTASALSLMGPKERQLRNQPFWDPLMQFTKVYSAHLTGIKNLSADTEWEWSALGGIS